MGILKHVLSRVLGLSSYSDPELRAIADEYVDQWPDHNDQYQCWKPDSILPAPKWAVKRAMKLAYAEWPEPIDWTMFNVFFMEFVDLARYLPQEQYSAIEKFRTRHITNCGTRDIHDPLIFFRSQSSTLAATYTIEQCIEDIISARDGLRDPVDVEDNELDAVRPILVESATEFATLVQEWHFYILSIGRDPYDVNRRTKQS